MDTSTVVYRYCKYKSNMRGGHRMQMGSTVVITIQPILTVTCILHLRPRAYDYIYLQDRVVWAGDCGSVDPCTEHQPPHQV